MRGCLIFSYALLFYYSWEFALWAGVAVLMLAAGSWWFTTRQIHHQRAVFKAQGAIDGLVFQMIIGLAKLRQAHAERSALLRWSKLYTEQKRAQLSARKWAAGQHTFNALFGPLSQLALLALIWYSLLEGGTTMAEDGEGETVTPSESGAAGPGLPARRPIRQAPRPGVPPAVSAPFPRGNRPAPSGPGTGQNNRLWNSRRGAMMRAQYRCFPGSLSSKPYTGPLPRRISSSTSLGTTASGASGRPRRGCSSTCFQLVSGVRLFNTR